MVRDSKRSVDARRLFDSHPTTPRRDDHVDAPRLVADALADALRGLGCRRAFGILGGAAVPLFSSLVRAGLMPTHARHESGAVFMALEHDLAGAGPGVVFTTTGPGLTNALTGIAAARHEGGRVVLISAATGADRRGRGAFQASDERSLAHCGLYAPGGWFDDAIALQSPCELPLLHGRLAEGLSRPGGFVAHVALPLSVQTTAAPREQGRVRVSRARAALSVPVLDACVRQLAAGPVVLWVGWGARHDAGLVRALVDAIDARVMCSPRAKGIFPETDPRFLGVTGFGGHPRLCERLARLRPATTLVLGSRLGEFTSFWDERLVGDSTLVHVDVDPHVFGAAYPAATTMGVPVEVGRFTGALLDALPPRMPAHPRRRHPSTAPRVVGDDAAGPVRPSALMRALQHVVVEGSDAPVLAEAGNAFVWATHALRFGEPGRFRTSMAFGSMGHFAAGVVGVALARSGPAIGVIGDGSMLMSHEVSTAVATCAPAIWVVLNDARYGLVADGMQGLGHHPHGLDFPRADFAAIARAQGATGIRVETESQLDEALREALAASGPVVVDVIIDPTEKAPFGARNRSLSEQLDGGARPRLGRNGVAS